ncbi:hypothetical protein HU200_062624 [Digitaria exilis]|uniref:Post-SET domain-containing protein n=1 Tax=Digitaria exilis TaxID=1010633 RepID=A0A835A7K1_9POAL|nr:hypothetical protein HU200_062624 [Digitaria exilis]
MEEPGAAARGREDHGADAQRLRGAEDALSVAVATEQVTATEVCGAPVARLSIDATQEKGNDFATGLVVPVEAVSASTDGRRFQIGQGNGSSLEQRVEEEKGGSLVPAPQSTAEPGSLQTCHEANGGFSSKTLCALKDTYSMLGETAEGSPFEQEGLVCNGGDWGAEARVIKATVEDLRIAFDEAHLDYAGLSGSMSHGSEQVPRAVDGIGSITDATDEVGNGADLGGKVQVHKAEDLRIACDEAQCDDAGVLGLISHGSEQVLRGGSIMDANDEVQQDLLMPDIEAEVSRPAQIDPVPSVSGGVDLSLDGKTGQFGGISGDLMACNVSDIKMCDGLCAAGGKGSQFIDARCMYDTVDMATGGPCQQDILATASHDNVDLSDPREHHSGKLPCGADALPLITGDNHGLEKVGFLPNVNAVTSGPVDENILSSIDVPLDGQVGHAIDTSENSAGFEKLVCDSLEGGRPLCNRGLWLEASGDENKHSDPCADKELQHTSLKYGTSGLSPEGNLCVSSYNQPCNDEPCCSRKESSAPCLGHQDSAVGGSGQLDHGHNAHNCANGRSLDLISNANDGESQSQKLTTLPICRRRNPKRAASSRKGSERPDQINQASSSTRKPKKVDVASSLQQSTMCMLPNKIAKGRSGMNRSSKPSTWGSLQELLDGFCQNSGPPTPNSHPTRLEKGRSGDRSDQKSQPSIRKSRSSRSSKSKCSSLSVTGHVASDLNGQLILSTVVDTGHAANELNGHPTFLTVADTDVSLESNREIIPKLSPDTSVNNFATTSNTAESRDSHRTVESLTDSQQLERALASSTKGTCTADLHGECAKLSTCEPSLSNANGNAMLHVGFSPDSVLEVASVTCEGNASASHDVMLHENSTDTGARNAGGYHPSTSNFGNEQGFSSLMNLEQQTKTSLHEDNRKDETGPPHAQDTDVDEGKSLTLRKSNAVRKINIVRKAGCKQKDGSKGKRKKGIRSTEISPCDASKLGPFSSESISTDPSELILRTGSPDFGSCSEALISGTQDRAMHEHDSIRSHSVMDGDKGSAFDSTKSHRRRKKDATAGKKGKARDPHKKEKSKNKNIEDDTSLDHGPLGLPSTDLAASRVNEQSNLDPATKFAMKNSGPMSTDLAGNAPCKTDGASVPPPPPPPRAAWVCCDDCQKWRCIPAELVDAIGETRWSNLFLHRHRSTQSIDEFQRRSYAKLRWFHSGKKGFGLQLQEDVTEGRFLIEYVGEVRLVLDITSYESRQSYYASKGQKHFYFMALNGGEGEELTFDYNYVRVSGAAPQKCFCGTAKCRGYIGGDISVLDTVTHADAEEAHFEQLDKDSEELIVTNGSDSDASHPNITEPEFSIQREDLHDCSAAKADLEPLEQTGGTFVETSEADNSLEAWSLQEDEDVTRTPVHVSQSYEISLQQFPVHDPRSSDLLQKTAKPTEGSKAPNAIDGSMPSSDFRNNLVPGFNDKKRNSLTQHKNPKPQLFSIDNEHILGVEGRLNNLLDVNGGISKRKDATNGYLKLLVVTAAEGDNSGGTSKSVRDLSLILDALLKTKSRSVLLDIINKNGLQMLHNMLKQNREKFHRTPIIRKLLKVLEFLAQKGILTSKHIHEGPRFAGVESFRESMLSLVRHRNFQVQQIARSFRDRWILHNSARSEPMEYPHPSTSAQNIQGTNMIWSSARRKRKSRWDYQPDEHYKMVGLKIQKVCSGQGELDVNKKLQRHQGTNNCHNDFHGMGSSTEGADDEVPPGFEPQQQCQPAQLPIGSEVAPGLCMERYQPSLGISYGVPVALVEHFGTPESEGGQCHKKWKVAPGVPFSPFPPLPPYPRGSPCPSTSSSQMFQHDGTSPVNHNGSGHCGRTAARDGRVHRTWRNEPRTKPPYHQQGRRFLSNHHRSERFEPPRPQ